MLLDEPSNHLDLESLIWLEGFLKAYEGALLMTSHDPGFPQPDRRADHRDRRRRAHQLLREPRLLREAAGAERGAGSGGLRLGQQSMLAKGDALHRRRFKAQAAKASQVQSRVKKLDKIEKVEPPKRRKALAFEFPLHPLGRGRRQDRRRAQALRLARRLPGARPVDPPQGALGDHGGERRRQVDAAQADRRRHRARRRVGLRRAERRSSAARAARDVDILDPKVGLRHVGRVVPAGQRQPGAEETGLRLLRLFGRRRRQDLPSSSRAARRRAWSWRAFSRN